METSAASSSDADASAGARSPSHAQLHAPSGALDASPPAAAAASPAVAAAAHGDGKRTGRPAHPLWAHFHRGEKRNRYHHHAFCVYCVARYGAAHVAPTRGVSVDMLRHVEKCPNCPSRVLESVRAICGRRDAVRFDRQLRKKSTAAAAAAAPALEAAAHAPHAQLGGDDAEHAQVVSDTESEQLDASDAQHEPSAELRRPRGVESAGRPRGAAAAAPHASADADEDADDDLDARDGDALPAAKRRRAHPPSAAESAATEWKVQLLKAAVAAGLPLQAFESAALQQLLRHVSPSRASAGLGDPTFLAAASRRLAGVQLDRVKEGMHNSTIKGGLTLSVNCWRARDLQQLVAFTLVNSNGDAACVRVLDMGAPYSAAQLAAVIGEVLERLEAQDISVMGIVADSTVALNAARRACVAAERRALMVVPCFARQLGVLAGSLLTHARFRRAVGQMVEIAAYFSNAALQSVLRLVSGDGDDARIPVPNRVNWHSFVDCVGAMLKYCDVVTAICSADDGDDDSGLAAAGAAVPRRLKDFVFADQGKLWKTLQELHTLLLPLQESYLLTFAHKLKPSKTPVAAHGLTLAHVMYQLARMNQQYAGLVGTHHAALAQLMQARIRVVWQRYDFPVMLLAYVFNFHLDTALLSAENDALQWPAIAAYFQAYFSAWFQSHAPVGGSASAAAAAGDEEEEQSSAAALAPISADKVREIFSAYKTKQFPFDADTTSDYVDVSSFYSFVSDSHPEICALCCRMYAISLLSAAVQRVVRGVGFVATSTQSTKDPKTVELLLHVGFASSTKRVPRAAASEPAAAAGDDCAASRRTSDSSQGGIAGLSAVLAGFHPDELFWNEDVWDDFAVDWREFVELELATDESDAIAAHARESESSSLPVVEMMSRKVPLDDVFMRTLAPLVAPDASAAKPTATAPPGVFAEESEL